ncbi:MAG: hypothetical protein K2R98_31410, partial [Gemmataceae bacterium]|nr:hypothetical protein [Gemmataceae bacterium]
MADSLDHPVLGQLRWEAEFSWWITKIPLPSGLHVDLIVAPEDCDRVDFVEQDAVSRRSGFSDAKPAVMGSVPRSWSFSAVRSQAREPVKKLQNGLSHRVAEVARLPCNRMS